MNKRQKKKNIKRAIERIGTPDFTKHDKHILKTYGRETFRAEYGLDPEVLDIDFEHVKEVVSNIMEGLREAVKQLYRSVGEAFTRMGSD